MDHYINYGKQWIEQDDIDAVIEALTSDFLTQGPKVKEFEDAVCLYTGAKYSIAVSNATAALQIAVKALNIEANSEGITSPNTFVASSNAFIYNHIKPVFADIDLSSYNIDPKEIEKRITNKTKVLIPVHFAGRPCDMKKIEEIAKTNDLYIIEDAAHAIGSNYEGGGKVGNCQFSDMTVFSFHPVKTMTTGEGGIITTNSKTIYDRLLLLRSHGITKDVNLLSENPGPWYYEMQELGYNFRLTDIQAALGISQLKKVDRYKKRRLEIIAAYNNEFSKISWLTVPQESTNSCFHLYVVQIDFELIKKSRAKVMEELRKKEIGTQVHYIPVHTQPYYMQNYNYKWGDYPVAKKYYQKALSLPLYPLMSDDDVEYVIKEVKGLNNY